MADSPHDESKITVSGLLGSLSETQNLFASVFAIVASVVTGLATWDKSKWIAVSVTGIIVSALLGWIYYRESKKKKALLPEPITDSAFIGLNAFEGKDRERFFGRGSEIGELFDKVTREDFRFGVLSGESGSGKTSLINAGLIPRLRDAGRLAIYLRLLNDPEQVIRKTVGKASKIDAKADEGLKDYLARVTAQTRSILVLCCDQFEEFFIHFPSDASREPFLSFVSACVQDSDLGLKFLFALREDFLSRILKFKDYIDEPLSTRKVFTLENFGTRQAAEIIERSVRHAKLPFEAGLSARVADDLAVNGRVLPTELQIVCLQMQRKHVFNQEKYRKIGEKEALVHSFLEDIVRLSGNAQDVKLVLRSLISEDNTKLALTVDQISDRTQKKHNLVQDILNGFVEARLLREIQDQEPWRYEFTHEYLIDKVNAISGSVMDEVKKANHSFRHYLRQYAIDPKTRIPLGKALQIRRYSDLTRNAREKELLAKSIRAGVLIYGLAGLAILGLSGTAFKLFLDQRRIQYRFENKMGVLMIDNTKKGKLSLERIHHYRDIQKYPAGTIELDGDRVDLEGPADYVLTDSSETPPLKYPVHIEGYNDRVALKLVPVPVPDKIPAEMVFIPPGEFRMGDKDSQDGVDADAKPHDVFLDGFLIDRTEVSNRAYRKFIEAGGYDSKDLGGKPVWSDAGWAFIARSEEKEPGYWNDEKFNQDDRPVVGVSWHEAEAYCRFMDKRLPTEAEWEKAARGPEGYNWSFGNNPDDLDSKANGAGEKDGYETTAPVIVEQYGANGYGLYHMSGNVWEWVQDGYDAGFYDREEAKLNPVNTQASELKIVRGGSWYLNPDFLRASDRYRLNPANWDYGIGFRCARTP